MRFLLNHVDFNVDRIIEKRVTSRLARLAGEKGDQVVVRARNDVGRNEFAQ
jgi:hypothetical protein